MRPSVNSLHPIASCSAANCLRESGRLGNDDRPLIFLRRRYFGIQNVISGDVLLLISQFSSCLTWSFNSRVRECPAHRIRCAAVSRVPQSVQRSSLLESQWLTITWVPQNPLTCFDIQRRKGSPLFSIVVARPSQLVKLNVTRGHPSSKIFCHPDVTRPIHM